MMSLSYRVSSVLNRDVKQFGKKFMFDSNEETCWNSDQGESQWVLLEFPQHVKVSEVRLQFQGGFSGKSCKLEGSSKDENLRHILNFYPEDNNSLQISFHMTLKLVPETASECDLQEVFELFCGPKQQREQQDCIQSLLQM